MINPLRVSVVIPAYNEETTLKVLFDKTFIVCSKVSNDFEIILCDDKSRDKTKAIIQGIAATHSQVKAIYHEQNQGLFKTFEELYMTAAKDYVLLLPGDGQWEPDFLEEAAALTGQFDIIVARRKAKKYAIGRQINSWCFNHLVLWLFGIDLYDIGSVKLVRREIFMKVKVNTQSAFTEAERMLKAYKLGYRIGSIDVEHVSRVQGKASGATLDKIIKAFGDLIAFRLTQWK